MTRLTGFAGLLVALPVAICAPAQAQQTACAAGLPEFVRGLGAFGLSGVIHVESGGRAPCALAVGYRNRDQSLRMTADGLFSIGSVTKQFTAAAVMVVVRAGSLRLTDSLGALLEGVPPDKASITVHQLLTHTAGLANFHDQGGGDFGRLDRDEALRRILAMPIVSRPGARYQYSNSGYTLLAILVERVTHRAFRAFVREEVVARAGLTETGFFEDVPRLRRPEVHGYHGERDAGSPATFTRDTALWGLWGNGGMVSTARDLARWLRVVGTRGLLDSAGTAMMLSGHVAAGAYRYGYGWVVAALPTGDTAYGHSGADDYGFGAQVRWMPARGIAQVVLLNREIADLDISPVTSVVADRVTAILLGAAAPAADSGRTVPVSWQRTLAGRYRLAGGGEFELRVAHEGLVLEPQDAAAAGIVLARDSADVARNRALTTRADTIARAALAGDFGPFLAALAPTLAPERAERFRAAFDRVLANARASGAAPSIMATGRIWWDPNDNAPASLVHIAGPNEGTFFRFHWNRDGIEGLGGSAVRRPPSVIYRRSTEGCCALTGHHLVLGSVPPLTWSREGRDVVLEIRVAGSPVVARRVR